jgi:hypothetical protein
MQHHVSNVTTPPTKQNLFGVAHWYDWVDGGAYLDVQWYFRFVSVVVFRLCLKNEWVGKENKNVLMGSRIRTTQELRKNNARATQEQRKSRARATQE